MFVEGMNELMGWLGAAFGMGSAGYTKFQAGQNQKDLEKVSTKAELLEAQLAGFKYIVATEYAAKTDLAEIKDALLRIERKLDSKADK